jgi:hypothetical protein
MKKIAATLGSGVLLALAAQPAAAADMDYQIQQIVVSGMVETWTGYSVYGDVDNDIDDPSDHASGGQSVRLSLPLGPNLSIQMDLDSEQNSKFLYSGGDRQNFEHSFQGGGHLSYRDPSSFLIGVFGGAGGGQADTESNDLYFVGGEAQLYLDNLTFYVQGGYLDSAENDDDDRFEDAVFVRGVGRWFITEDSRLQAEVSYADGNVDGGGDNQDIVEWGVRYDTMLGLPIVGDTNVFAGYRGGRFENNTENNHVTDHTLMVGFRTAFGGNTMQEFDRVGATLDLPNFGRWVSSGHLVE